MIFCLGKTSIMWKTLINYIWPLMVISWTCFFLGLQKILSCVLLKPSSHSGILWLLFCAFRKKYKSENLSHKYCTKMNEIKNYLLLQLFIPYIVFFFFTVKKVLCLREHSKADVIDFDWEWNFDLMTEKWQKTLIAAE